MMISPTHRSTDFPSPLTLDQKILIFEDRTIGWQLGIANRVINGSATSTGQRDATAIPGSGYAVLSIVLSYFELIAKYKAGYAGSHEPSRYFKDGVRDVFPQIASFAADVVDDFLDALYSGGRCGLYHGGMTDTRIILTGEIMTAMAFYPYRLELVINPHLLVPALLSHFRAYIDILKDPANADARARFQNRFDAESQ